MLRFFHEKSYFDYDFKHRDVSKYFPKPMCWNLESVDVKNSHYIICPVYGNKHKWTDFQIGVTGALGNGESPKIGMSRELKEELGILPKNGTDLVKTVSETDKGKKWYMYTLNIKDTWNVGRKLKINVTDSRVNKVGCIVYGNKADTQKYMNSSIVLYESGDNIIGAAAIPAKLLRDHVDCRLY